jgi:transposase-like protein
MSKTRRNFSAEQKADVVRRYVKDKVAISDLAAE